MVYVFWGIQRIYTVLMVPSLSYLLSSMFESVLLRNLQQEAARQSFILQQLVSAAATPLVILIL